MLKGKNQVVYGDCEALSDAFVSRFINKKSDIQEIIEPEVKPVIRDDIRYVSSKQELYDLGATPVAPGIWKDAQHHLWQLRRDADGYVIERTAEEETLREAKESKTASKKSAAIYTVEKEFTIPGFEHIVFSPTEEVETFKTSAPSDKYQTSIIKDMLDREVPVMDTTLSNLIQNRYITKVANKVSSTITVKSDTPLDSFTKDLDQSGVYYQKRSSETDTDTGKLVASFDVEDKDLDTFKSVANDYGIIVEAKIAEIKDAPKVFSDETIVKGISHYMNMGFTKNEAVKEFISSNDLDKEYKKKIEDVLDKYGV